ncbi:hypothetical protein R1sor_013557 [Riccia sorocarpa]|uniref:Uncharacterized protein n=1 Tax=Riccia sorocarpa TaxID=122646 RepID=A0ABD3H7H4_9MARC
MAVRDSPSRLALSPKLTSVDLPTWSSSLSGATVPTSTLLRSDSATSWVMGIDPAILIHDRNRNRMSKTLSPLFRKNFVCWLAGTVRIAHPIYDEQLQYFYESPLVNVRGVKRKLEEAVTMLADLENVGQIDDKHAAIAALCEDGMECLQKREAALEAELEKTLHELMETRLDIFKKQVQMDDDSRRHSDELDRLSPMMSVLNKDVSTLSKKLDVALATRIRTTPRLRNRTMARLEACWVDSHMEYGDCKQSVYCDDRKEIRKCIRSHFPMCSYERSGTTTAKK